jgi:hypothetical protein
MSKICPANGLECKYTFCLPGICSIQEVAKHQGVTSCDTTMVVVQSAQPSPGYTKEQMGEAYEQGAKDVLKDICETFSDKNRQKRLHKFTGIDVAKGISRDIKDFPLPDRDTYLRSLPPAKDAGVLVDAIEEAVKELSGEPSEENASRAFGLLSFALITYNR